MFFRPPKNPSRLKRVAYLFCSVILGVLLSLIAHALIEMSYLSWAGKQNLAVTFYNGCVLLPVFQIALVLSGAVGGFFLGRFWWRIVYIERFWEKK